jgi:hypothetical protein
MKIILFLLTMITSLVVRADLLDRIHLEDTIRTRIEDVFHLYDDKAKVLIHFDYKSFSGFLPGTNVESKTASPDRIEPGDITKLYVEIYSELEQIPPEAKTVVMHVIPFESTKVSVEYKQLKPQFPKDVPRAIDSQSLATIAQNSVSSLGKVFGIVLFLSMISFLFYAIYSNYIKMKEFKFQISALTQALTQALSESGMSGGSRHAPMEQKSQTISVQTGEDKIFDKFPKESLRELFADCYWTHEDGYATWLWKKISSEQKSYLLESLPPMKEYSLTFLQNAPQELSAHDHPYYLNPSALSFTSQEDLSQLVKATPGLWRRVGPLRQRNLTLSLEEKLQAMSSLADVARPVSYPKSSLRELQLTQHWGHLSEADENTLYQNPNLIPDEIKPTIQSLVWLAQKDTNYIKTTLEKYDARSLASAWIGPREVLEKLEKTLPEKKVRLLQTYKTKVPATRDSEAYQSLVKEGLTKEGIAHAS